MAAVELCGRAWQSGRAWAMAGVLLLAPAWMAWPALSILAWPGAAHAQPAGERLIHQGKAMFGGIYVTEGRGLRTLYFELNGARQSAVRPGEPDHLELPYARAAMAALALARPQPERFLVVGLGGGSIPMFLRQRYPRAQIDVAEIDPAVLDVATRFLGFRQDARLRVHIGDGRAFVEKAQAGSYDVIWLDAFGASEVPPHLVTAEFLSGVRRALRGDGVAVGNVWGPVYNRIYGPMMRSWEAAFERVVLLDVGGAVNRLAMGMPRQDAVTEPAMEERAGRIGRERNFPYDLGALVRSGWLEREDYSAHAVLHDQR